MGTAATLAPHATQRHPDNAHLAALYLAAVWAPVDSAYAELAATVRSG
ncbi:MAG: hypothetical protein ACRDRU_12355 [Pseudonocardiaceae bacterium]